MDIKESGASFCYRFTVGTFDVGRGNVMRLRELLKYQQQAGEEHLLTFGSGHKVLEDDGFAFVVASVRCVIHRLPGAGEKIDLVTWAHPTRHAHYPRYYNWYDEAGALVVESAAVFVLIDIASRKISRTDPLGENLPVCDYENAATPSRLRFESGEKVGERVIVPSMIDINGHLNNSYYADFITDYAGVSPREFSIDFVGEALQNDVIVVYRDECDGRVRLVGEHGRGVCFKAECE